MCVDMTPVMFYLFIELVGCLVNLKISCGG